MPCRFMPAVTIQSTKTQVVQSKEYKELKAENEALRRDIEAMQEREEARTPYDEKMTKILERLVNNPEIKELIKKELKEIS